MEKRVQNSLLKAFREEFHTDLAAIRADWTQYSPGQSTNVGDLSDLLRRLHTMKGSTRLLSFDGLPEMIHGLEEFVLEALNRKRKPESFLDRLSDLEEAVAQRLGTSEVSVELDGQMVTAEHHRQDQGAGELSAAYRVLLDVDELVQIGETLRKDFLSLASAKEGTWLGHHLELMVEKAKSLREKARQMSLIPSTELFVGLTELVRRLAREQGKKVTVDHQVASDHLERSVVLSLRPALLHLSQNALTHGIPLDSGMIRFGYERRPTELVVTVSDNGSGLPLGALREAVVRGGYLTAEAWDALSSDEQLSWIFHPGLSTKTEADLSSGRGMGMAVVAETVERLGGRIEIDSGAEGTEFRLLIPSHWNLRDVLQVSCGRQQLCVVSRQIQRVESAKLSEVGEGVRYLGSLGSLLGYGETGGGSHYRLLIESSEGKLLAVGVDDIGAFEEVLVTPLDGFENLPSMMVGVTPKGESFVPVVSLKHFSSLRSESVASRTVSDAPTKAPLLLVVDDSITTRSLVTGILESDGFRVLTAADGQEALDVLKTESVSLVISDLQMPVLDGLGFLEILRAQPETAHLPFVLLTSIDDVATFEKASGLGADRCLGKQNFTQDLLLRTVKELL